MISGVLGSLLAKYATLLGGVLASLLGKVGALYSGVLVPLWGKTVTGLSGFLNSTWERSVSILGGLLGTVWGVVVFVSLFGAAVVLRVLGVDDVYATLGRMARGDGAEKDPVQRVRDVPSEAVMDDAGRFSTSKFTNVTGMTPAEFVHLFVRHNGGCVRQGTLNACLPWSKSTVSRLLDTLERDDVVARVDVGRRNLVCTPESVPAVVDE